MVDRAGMEKGSVRTRAFEQYGAMDWARWIGILFAGWYVAYLLLAAIACFTAWTLEHMDLSTWEPAGRIVLVILCIGWLCIGIQILLEKDEPSE